MKSGIYFVAVLFLGSALGLQTYVRNKGYRWDYSYSNKTRAYYKIHSTLTNYNRASAVCDVEGAQLMILSSIEEERMEEIAMIHRVVVANIGSTNIWVSDKNYLESNGDGHESDSDSSCAVITADNVIEKYDCDKELPYVCKVEAKDALYDEQCGVYSTGYTYLDEVGKCYRVPDVAYKWFDAYEECRAEGANLAVLESQEEAEAVQEFLEAAPNIDSAFQKHYYLAGIYEPSEGRPPKGPARFQTHLGTGLDETGYNEWSPGEPNDYENYEYCGAISANDGKYNDVSCYDYYAFLCKSKI